MEVKVDINGPGGNAIDFIRSGGKSNIMVPTSESVLLFNKYSVQYGDVVGNALGLYSIGSIGRNGEVLIGKLGHSGFNIQPRGNGCAWTPLKGMTSDFQAIQVSPWKIQHENCVDTLWGSFMERILGVGNGVVDWSSSPESQALMMEIVRQIFIAQGNSFAMLTAFGMNDLITESDTKNLWVGHTRPQDWENFLLTTKVHKGHYTYMDELQVSGPSHMDVEMDDSWFGDDGSIIGANTAQLFVDRLIDSAPSTFGLLNSQMVSSGQMPIIKLSKAFFEKFAKENRVMNMATLVDKVARDVFHTGVSTEYQITPNTYSYRGYYIVKDEMQARFDAVTGTLTHRGFNCIAGNLGVITDIGFIPGFDGTGLRLFQDLDDPTKAGMIYVDGYAKSATAILDTDFITHGAKSFEPEAI